MPCPHPRRAVLAAAAALTLLLPLTGCGPGAAGGSRDAGAAGSGPGSNAAPILRVGAIPDQEPQRLQRLYGTLARYLQQRLGVRVAYRPVTDYTATVTGFRVGDLDLVWFGGLTGVQARRQVPGTRVLAQRDIDRDFHSVFVAHAGRGLRPVRSLAGLSELEGHTFTYGSESSTSGRVMPQYFLARAGVATEALRGRPGSSGSHDKTIDLVQSGTYDAGALNEQVWRSRLAAGTVDTSKVRPIWRSPGFHDYHWAARPDLDARFGAGFTAKVRGALLALDRSDPRQRQVLDLFGARRFVPANAAQYQDVEAAARADGLLG